MRIPDDNKLFEFIRECKAKGASDEFLAALLPRFGWPAADVYSSLGAYWQEVTGVALPERTGRGGSARDAFLYLLSFSTLATWSTALGSLLFQFIDHWFPDPVMADMSFAARSQETWQMACIAVAFPTFVFTVRTILREAQDRPERLESDVRKWLTYIALLLTAGSVIADLICFLDYFLGGELTVRFVLKAASVLIICGAIFIYYLRSLHWDRNVNIHAVKRWSTRYAAGTAAVVLAAFCTGLIIAGNPAVQRHLDADQRRVQDLKQIAASISTAYHAHNSNDSLATLPDNIYQLQKIGLGLDVILDPETKQPYRYIKKSGDDYELCATFSANQPKMNVPARFWRYGKGQTCFVLRATEPAPVY